MRNAAIVSGKAALQTRGRYTALGSLGQLVRPTVSHWTSATLLSAALGLLACGPKSQGDTPGESIPDDSEGGTETTGDTCGGGTDLDCQDRIVGRSFSSCPDGRQSASLAFTQDTFRWSTSGVVLSGTYSCEQSSACDGLLLRGLGSQSNEPEYEGYYDPVGRTLTWDGGGPYCYVVRQ